MVHCNKRMVKFGDTPSTWYKLEFSLHQLSLYQLVVSALDVQIFFFCDKPHSLANHPNQKSKKKKKKKTKQNKTKTKTKTKPTC